LSYFAMPFGMEKLEWCGYPKVKKFDDIFSRFDRIPACDGQTDGQTDRHLATAQSAPKIEIRTHNRCTHDFPAISTNYCSMT